MRKLIGARTVLPFLIVAGIIELELTGHEGTIFKTTSLGMTTISPGAPGFANARFTYTLK